jgi:hypothetical protein
MRARRIGPAVPAGSAEASRVAACVLEVLSGLRSVTEAAAELGVSSARYYQLEARALAGLVQCCEPVKRGRAASAGHDVARLRKENERLARECQRQQALVRLARQAAGLSAPADPPSSPVVAKKRRRTSRAQQAAERLRQAAIAGAEGQPVAAES